MKLHKNTSISHNTLKQEGTLWHKKQKQTNNKKEQRHVEHRVTEEEEEQKQSNYISIKNAMISKLNLLNSE